MAVVRTMKAQNPSRRQEIAGVKVRERLVEKGGGPFTEA